MISNARGSHSSPGIYTKEIDLSYAAKSLGITTLGVVGETLKGPAFEPIRIENWREFQEYFGGTSAEKFVGSKYPKYELPYIAQSYLKNSNQLEVCRVLGLSGYNAGPAWLITASKGKKLLKGHYESYGGYISAATMTSISLYGKEYSSYKNVDEVPSELLIENDKVYPFLLLNVSEFFVWKYDDVVEGKYDVYNGDVENIIGYTKEKYGDTAPSPTNVTEVPKELYRSTDNTNVFPSVYTRVDSVNTFYTWNSAVKALMYEDEKNEQYVVAVLRSRGAYDEYGTEDFKPCETNSYSYDVLKYAAKSVGFGVYQSATIMMSCDGETSNGDKKDGVDVNINNMGRFTIIVNGKNYPVSLNPEDKDYILNVLGTSNQDGDAPIFVEELYDVALYKMIANGDISKIDIPEEAIRLDEGLTIEEEEVKGETVKEIKNYVPKVPSVERVLDFADNLPEYELTYKNVGQRYVSKATENKTAETEVQANVNEGYTPGENEKSNEDGLVFATKTITTGDTTEIVIDDTKPVMIKKETIAGTTTNIFVSVVETYLENGKRKYRYTKDGDNLTDGSRIFIMAKDAFYEVKGEDLEECSQDINDYKEQFRCASTPWVVSELKGDGNTVEVRKLFRFHTISDGDAANSEVKVSIQNIRPDEGLFDVIVRAFDDMDSNPIVLERFLKCSMVQGTPNFIGLKIGTFDGEYIIKSKYITVEVVTNDMTEACVPAGFLGYPMRDFGSVNRPSMGYNTFVDEDIKPKKQYFGFSNITGIDVDLFKYKGRAAYNNVNSLSAGFHLDSRIKAITGMTVYVDGKENYEFITVDPQNTTSISGDGAVPMFGLEAEMADTIYEDINLRKFTVCFYGGFDGWDIYRESRTNTDKFKANKYKGVISNGNGTVFNQIYDTDGLNLTGKCITSDYYAYLAGIRQFVNPEAYDINVFATPGIDYVNNTYLSQEALTMVEEDRGDCIYIMTTPDKSFGNGDNDMLYPGDVVENLRDSEISSSYAATYYPWVKYYDKDNKVYINLPVTKDVVRSLAYTDNTSYPWFAPAGIIRGGVDCERAHFITKLEDEDTLYENMINPIKTFATDGVKIWGQKTMYGEDTPLNRINVRRLMLRVKKLITGACRRLIFEQNDATVKSQFEGLVKPILDDIKAKRGIYDYRLEIQDSPEARDRMELPAVIYIKPTKALEYIDLSFVIMPESAKFDE